MRHTTLINATLYQGRWFACVLVTRRLLRPSITWAIAFVVFSAVVRRVAPEGPGPRYRVGWWR